MGTVFTHNKTFHSDEILAIALLEKFFFYKNIDVKRTRDVEILDKAKQDPSVFVIDVGFEYDPAFLNFDHHQGTLTAKWSDGTPYSACGLIWIWLKEQGSLSKLDPTIIAKFEVEFIQKADKLDNGLDTWAIGDHIFAYNREKDPQTQQHQFSKALRVAHESIDNVLHQYQLDLDMRKKVEEALRTQFDAHHGILKMNDSAGPMTKLAHELSGNQVNLVMSPRAQEQWLLITTPETLDDPFSQKCPAPKDWRGRSDFQVMVGGEPIQMVFCHKNGFMCIVQGTEKQALAAAQYVVQQHLNLEPSTIELHLNSRFKR